MKIYEVKVNSIKADDKLKSVTFTVEAESQYFAVTNIAYDYMKRLGYIDREFELQSVREVIFEK